MSDRMNENEWRAFLSEGTRTAKLSTVSADGSPHVAPVWFLVEGGDLVFNTGKETVKGRNLLREGRAAVCVEDEREPFAFVVVRGPVTISEEPGELRDVATRVAARYMGAERGKMFGERNAVPGELVVRLRMDKVTAFSSVSD
ncbi:PPOX class F420-dependent oxidoreductase [Streptomyces sp. 8L]|uniref:PPOX class F420-dependent oxidoreductase n=1 Tax=Streptomyces sp. 8L TaxID=2877242 RepID=UPI001CD52A8D|nr:PPOX class F420-dependent oxidoreductase [Streptomyces sp. 8L]MCA1222490.1 PPOX class F420-dependent oxidoreductase [Streptomyces sp. 8L]